MRYEIVQCASLRDFEMKIQEMIDDSWKPQGGVAVVFVPTSLGPSDLRYAQAMIRE